MNELNTLKSMLAIMQSDETVLYTIKRLGATMHHHELHLSK